MKRTLFIPVLLISISTIFFACKTGPAEKPAAVSTKPESVQWTRLGFGQQLEGYLAVKDFDGAIESFTSIPQEEADKLDILMLKVSVLISAGRIEEATTIAKDLEKKYPKDTEVLYVLAMLATAQNNSTERNKYLTSILTHEPNNSDALTGVGLDFFSKKNYPKAKELLLRATLADSSNTDALLGLARVYYMQNELLKSRDALSLAISKEPDYSIPHAELARVQSEMLELPQALVSIQKALEIDPSIYSHWTDYGSYLITAGKREEAQKAFTEAIKIDPAQYIAYIYRAGLNDDLGLLDEAVYDYTMITKIYPQYFYAFESLGVLLWGKKDYAGSREAFTQALTYQPLNSSYALMRTLCFFKENKEAEGRAFMTKYMNTLNRTSTEYFLCRLFVDKSGDADVINRILKEKNLNTRNKMLFYTASFYELFQSKTVAQKYFLEVVSNPSPSFFEFRLSTWALKALEEESTR